MQQKAKPRKTQSKPVKPQRNSWRRARRERRRVCVRTISSISPGPTSDHHLHSSMLPTLRNSQAILVCVLVLVGSLGGSAGALSDRVDHALSAVVDATTAKLG